MNRREYLRTTAGLTGVAALAGCSAAGRESDGDSNDESGAVSTPTPAKELLTTGGWERVASDSRRLFERRYLGGQVRVTADAHVDQYEDVELRRELKRKTLGQLDTPLSVFTATRVEMDPDPGDLPFGLGVAEVVGTVREQAKASFVASLEDAGLTNVRETGEEQIAVESGGEAPLTRYLADFEYDAMAVPVPGTSNEHVTIEGGMLEVSGLLAIWRDDAGVLVAGGAHPATNVTASTEAHLTDAITVDIDVDLGLTPERYERELRRLVSSLG